MPEQDIITRWDNYLKKLNDRFYEVLSSADEPFNSVIDGLQYDNIVIINALNGLKDQSVYQLHKKAEEGWEKMQAEIYKSGKLNIIPEQAQKVESLRAKMESEFEKYEIKLFAKAARKIFENVQKHIDENKIRRCTQCAADLPVSAYSFMAVNIKCESCGSVNTFQPDDRIRALEYYVIEPLANEYAMEEKIKGKTDKNMMKEYYRKFYGFLIEKVPDKKEFYERTMNERLTNPHFG
jgi:hypothetical protein